MTKRMFVVLLCIIFSGAQASADIAEGDKELTLNVSFFHQQDSDAGTLSGDGSFGYMLSDQWEVGFRQAITSTFVDNGSDTWVATTSPFFRFNFNSGEDQPIVPYVGAFTGVVWNDEDVTGTVGPEAGVRFFVTDSAFVSTQYRYEWFFSDLDLDDLGDDLEQINDNKSDGNHVATVGVGVAW
jgi:hypothetical protein